MAALNTVNSQKSLASSTLITDSHLPSFTCGQIIFDDGQQRLRQASSYIRVPVDIDIEEVAKYVSLKWFKKCPKIIITIITGLTHFKNWKNQKQLSKFKRGITKAAYSTELVYITNGYNQGVSKLMGDAFREESLTRRVSYDTSPSYSNSSEQNVDELDRLVLMGIVSTSDLRHAELLKGTQEVVTYKIEESESNMHSLDLNPDHTHFILVDDENIHLKLLKFRVALEKHLQNSIFGRKSRNKSMPQSDPVFVVSSSLPVVKECVEEKHSPTPETTPTATTTVPAPLETSNEQNQDKVPIVSLLIGGGVGSISLVLAKINQSTPVLVFKGTGHAPDLISGAYEDFADRYENLSDNHLRTAITIRITEKFPKESKDDSTRNKIKDNLLQIIKFSKTQESGNLLTFIDSASINSELDDTDKYILLSLLQSLGQPGNEQSKEFFKKNLMPLILDWNRFDIALSEIFQREGSYKLDVDKSMFEKALLKKNREEFIEIFLDQGFQIHRFLNHLKMFTLFEKCEDRDFFLTVCIEKGLGNKLTQSDFDEMRLQPPELFQKFINPLVKKLSDINDFFQPLEMSLNALKLYIEAGEIIAERKSLVYLIVFAVLLKRHKLAKILWKRSDQPICTALLCSMMYMRLSLLCHENYIKSELDEYSKDFACCAIGVLDLSFSQSDLRVYDVLDMKNSDLNGLSVIELAYNSNNKDFLSHPCCQKWITKRFYGSINVRELNFGLFKLPTWIKILGSAFFILPMYLWIVFPTDRKNNLLRISSNKNLIFDSDRDEQDDQDEEKMIRNELMNISSKKPEDEKKKNIKGHKEDFLTVWEKIYLVWSAPITKFWINLVFYLIYLSIFGIAVLWPSCGNIVIDSIVWCWTALICCETARRTYNKYVIGSNLPLKYSCFEILIMLLFLVLYLFIRILATWHFDVLTAKSVLCLGLIYFYYRSVFVYLPISPTLGPMLVKMKYMVRVDFLTFLRMFLVFMAAGGITINAIIYPYYPLNSELIKRVFLRSFFGLFVTEKEDLNGRKDECHAKMSLSSEYCTEISERLSFNPNGTTFHQNHVKSTCAYPSLIGWGILIQYLLLVKLFLTTLLTAMFSHTKARVDAESDQIWMYQRYEIVIDYEHRLRLPPPLTIISYIIMLTKWFMNRKKHSYIYEYRRGKSLFFDRKSSEFSGYETKGTKRNGSAAGTGVSGPDRGDKERETKQNSEVKHTENVSLSKKQIDHTLYWKIIVQDFAKKLDDSAREKDIQKEQAIGLFRLREEFQSQKRNIKRLDDRMVSIERNLTAIQVTVEYLKHFLINKDLTGGLKSAAHIMARQSPYPFTTQSRFPVFDKYVNWEIFYDSYDPPLIVVDKLLNFTDRELPLIDPDDLNLIELMPHVIEIKQTIGSASRMGLPTSSSEKSLNLKEELSKMSTDQADASQQQPKNDDINVLDIVDGQLENLSLTYSERQKKLVEKWNRKTMCLIKDQKVIIDRSSWITTKNGKQIKYTADTIGYPMNPMGRTGARGRGILWRWGPNHTVRVIVTRWRKFRENLKHNHQPNKYMHVEGRRMLEFLACRDSVYGEWKLPGDRILGDVSIYEVACKSFRTQILEKSSSESGPNEEREKIVSTEEDMKGYFSKFAQDSDSIGTSNKAPSTSQTIQGGPSSSSSSSLSSKFMAKRIFKGYIDDPRNTDNSWVEAEIWNFHYGDNDILDDVIPNVSSKWKEVSSHVRLFGNQNDILKEVASIHQAYY